MTVHKTSFAIASVCLALAGSPLGAAPTKVHLKAYINQSSGCQVPTETFLKKLAATYKGRVDLTFVNFGEPTGRKIWRQDGMHCMGIKIDGSTKASILYKGVKLDVAFEMPVGHRWLHDELATAVRQKLEGVKPSDKVGPPISVKASGNKADLLAGGTAILRNLQLDKAIEVVLGEIEANPHRPPERPAYPDRSGK